MNLWVEYFSRYSDWLRAGCSGDRNPVGARFSTPAQIGPGVHPAACTMGTGSFQGVKSGRGVTLTPHPLLVPWSRKRRAIPLLPLWAVRPVQSLRACTRVHFTFLLTLNLCCVSYPLMFWFIFQSKCFLLILVSSPRCVHLCIILHVCCCRIYPMLTKNDRNM